MFYAVGVIELLVYRVAAMVSLYPKRDLVLSVPFEASQWNKRSRLELQNAEVPFLGNILLSICILCILIQNYSET